MRAFDLEAAKRGDPIQTKSGIEAKFIAHVPLVHAGQRVVTRIGNTLHMYTEQGLHPHEPYTDLVMAPASRKVWLNLYAHAVSVHTTPESAGDEDLHEHCVVRAHEVVIPIP